MWVHQDIVKDENGRKFQIKYGFFYVQGLAMGLRNMGIGNLANLCWYYCFNGVSKKDWFGLRNYTNYKECFYWG